MQKERSLRTKRQIRKLKTKKMGLLVLAKHGLNKTWIKAKIWSLIFGRPNRREKGEEKREEEEEEEKKKRREEERKAKKV